MKQKQALEAIEALKTVLDSGLKLEGLGLKRLGSNDIWEIRTSLKDRIVFSFKQDNITFILVGNHEDVRNYLKDH
ncbi:MAG TPA: hypothetical protein VMT55_02275 [Candidatus Sulfotelmatobacter sp.]|nr:hypothetical protein [Candidatus Sulfotelmatobacter sp.]